MIGLLIYRFTILTFSIQIIYVLKDLGHLVYIILCNLDFTACVLMIQHFLWRLSSLNFGLCLPSPSSFSVLVAKLHFLVWSLNSRDNHEIILSIRFFIIVLGNKAFN